MLLTLECGVEACSRCSAWHLAGVPVWWGVWWDIWEAHSPGLTSACLWLDWYERNQDSFYSSGWFLKTCLSSSASGFALAWVNVRKDSLASLWDIKDGCIKVMGPSWACKPLYILCTILCWEDYWVNIHSGQKAKQSPSHPSHKVASSRSCAM